MPMTTMTTKGQITIPKEIRDSLRIKPKDRVVFTVDGDHAILHPVHADLFELHNIDFVDAYHAAFMEHHGISTVYSYDTDFDQLTGITRREP